MIGDQAHQLILRAQRGLGGTPRLLQLGGLSDLLGTGAQHHQICGELRGHERKHAQVPLLVVPLAPADEEDADHVFEPDQRHRQMGAPHDPRRLQLQSALLEHLPVQLHQRDGEPVLLLGRQRRQRRQPRIGPRLRLEERALLVRHQLAEELDGAGHARLCSLGRLEHLRDVLGLHGTAGTANGDAHELIMLGARSKEQGARLGVRAVHLYVRVRVG